MGLIAGGKTDPGEKRPNNEDAFYLDEKRGLFIVADGMGGHRAGEVASETAIEEIKKLVRQSGTLRTPDDLQRAIDSANQAAYLKSLESPDFHGMGTTLVVAQITNGKLLLAHVGDSRAYLLGERGLERLTEDHSVIYQYIKEGRITEEEARKHPRKGGILRALGVEKFVEADTKELPYNGETLLLCTDGVTDMLRDEEIEEILKNNPDPRQACEQLVEKANQAGGWDNITVIVAKGR